MNENSTLFLVIIVIICQKDIIKVLTEFDDDGYEEEKASKSISEIFPGDFDFLPVSHNFNKEPISEKSTFEGIQYPFLVRIGIRNKSYQ